MKRGTKCVVQTINLSNPKTCIKPKVQGLVSANVDSACDPNRASDYWTPRPVAVKVCSWKDAQRRCPPKVRGDCRSSQSYTSPLFMQYCEFPPEPPPLSTNAKLCRVATFFAKGAIVAALICWTCTEGLWGDGAETEDLYYRMTSVIFPDRPAASLEEIKCTVFEAYNRAVVEGMDIIVGASTEVHRRLRDLLFPCDAAEERTQERRSGENPAEM
ncbi:PREDICTED: uncharacterized protein LOC105561868 [Vollenhovia emeryi]|uniref:uncharacterized protein LOC105561868 n=1 Tax=Vollenhovia emeryi TaxID=411798 RepID=UPI0005F4876E|nr:PREDICTED: uncharacterized protein LOC105561868 [Vollenhovia emeryi]